MNQEEELYGIAVVSTSSDIPESDLNVSIILSIFLIVIGILIILLGVAILIRLKN